MSTIATPAGVHKTVNGIAWGWSVHQPVKGGRWHWSAYGPNGGTMSTAATREEAEQRASKEAEWLSGRNRAVAGT